ncbi:MAG: hypothetical protein AAF698_06465 [Pseudomonadota bacterium]
MTAGGPEVVTIKGDHDVNDVDIGPANKAPAEESENLINAAKNNEAEGAKPETGADATREKLMGSAPAEVFGEIASQIEVPFDGVDEADTPR